MFDELFFGLICLFFGVVAILKLTRRDGIYRYI